MHHHAARHVNGTYQSVQRVDGQLAGQTVGLLPHRVAAYGQGRRCVCELAGQPRDGPFTDAGELRDPLRGVVLQHGLTPLLESVAVLGDEGFIVKVFEDDHPGHAKSQQTLGAWLDGYPLVGLDARHRQARLDLHHVRPVAGPAASHKTVGCQQAHRRLGRFYEWVVEIQKVPRALQVVTRSGVPSLG